MRALLLLILLGTSPYLVKGTWIRDEHSSEEQLRHPPITVVSGPINQGGSSGEGDRPWGWSRHVDFNERFPDGDQIAVESEGIRPAYEINPSLITRGLEHDELHRPGDSVLDDEVEIFDDRLVVPSFSNIHPRRQPPIGGSSEEFSNIWSSIFRGMRPKPQWWQGSNVCIKREESKGNNDNSTFGSEAIMNLSPMSNASDLHLFFTACEDLDTKRVCVTKLIGPQAEQVIKTEYECCSGYALDKDKSVCEQARFESVANTMERLGGNEFVRLVKTAGLNHRLEDENSTTTVFVPIDAAVTSYLSSSNTAGLQFNSIDFLPAVPDTVRRRRSILRHQVNEPGGRNVRRYSHRPNQEGFPEEDFDELGENDEYDEDWKDMKQHHQFQREGKRTSHDHFEDSGEISHALLNHMVQGKISTDDFVDEKVIYSEDQGGTLRMNTWQIGQGSVKTINCVRLVSINHKCTNGMVHMVDSFIRPATKNLNEIISTHPQLSLWNSLLNSAEMTQLLQDNSQHLTVFAPTNAALNKLGPSFLLNLQRRDTACLKRIVRHHILPITFCSSIIHGKGAVRNLDNDELLALERTPDDKLSVNGSELIVRDIMTKNGVVHILDAVILNDNDKPMSQILERDGYSTFVNLTRQAGIDIDALSNVTLFVPSSSALDKLPDSVLEDREKLKEMLLYHISNPEIRSCHFIHQQSLPTLLRNESIRINWYSQVPFRFFGSDANTFTTAQCAKLTRTNIRSCGGVAHEIDRVIMPPTGDLIQTLKSTPETSIFTRLIAEHDDLLGQLKRGSYFTVFAPTDSTFKSLPQDTLDSILHNKSQGLKIIKRHITTDPLCCAGVPHHVHFYFMMKRVASLGDLNVPVIRDSSGAVTFGTGKVTTCDMTTSNGIIHLVNKVLVDATSTSHLPEPLDYFNVY